MMLTSERTNLSRVSVVVDQSSISGYVYPSFRMSDTILLVRKPPSSAKKGFNGLSAVRFVPGAVPNCPVEGWTVVNMGLLGFIACHRATSRSTLQWCNMLQRLATPPNTEDALLTILGQRRNGRYSPSCCHSRLHCGRDRGGSQNSLPRDYQMSCPQTSWSSQRRPTVALLAVYAEYERNCGIAEFDAPSEEAPIEGVHTTWVLRWLATFTILRSDSVALLPSVPGHLKVVFCPNPRSLTSDFRRNP